MKQKDIFRLHALANLAHAIKQQGEDHASDTILAHIAHTIAEAFERTSDGKSSDPTSV